MAVSMVLEVLLNGVVMGLIYALMGLGLAFVYNVMRIMNFAHGEFFTIGGYTYFWLSQAVGMPIPLAIVLAVLAGAVLGWVVARLVLHPVSAGKVQRPEEYTLVVTLALMILFQKILLQAFGPFGKQAESLLTNAVSFGSFHISGERLFVAIGGTVAVLALYLGIRHTWLGKMFVATSQSRTGAQVIGLPVIKMHRMAFAIGGSLAAVAGVLLGPVFSVFPTAGTIPVFKGFVVIAFAGLGSVMGTVPAGLLLGVVETVGAVYLNSGYRDVYAFILLIVILLFRPQGLFGEKERAA